MTLDRYFRISSYTLLFSSFLMLVATRQLDVVAICLFTLVLLVSWQVDAGRLSWKLSPSAISIIMLIFLPFPFIDWLVLGTAPIIALIHFIFFASALKLLQFKRNRDWIWLYVVSFFQMLLAAGMMIDTTFFILLLFFLFSAISTLVSFEMRRAQQDVQISSPERDETEFWRETKTARASLAPPHWRSIAFFSALSLLTILVLATPLFLAMPRLALRNPGTGWMPGAALSGFSETVHLGDVGQLKLNPKLVMRVRVIQPPDQYRTPLRWRGVTLDYYDGSNWRDSNTFRRSTKADARPVTKHGNVYWVDETQEINHAEMLRYITRQTFYLEPLGTPTIFAAPRPLWVEGLASLWNDESDGLWTSNHVVNRLSYQVESDTRQPTDRELRELGTSTYGIEIASRYLQLPETFDPRITALASSVTKNATNTIDVARAIETHLRSSYAYSLDLRRTGERDPVADFLFNIRAGHCEYFATAMALMLRSQGVASRVVNGFQMGEYSDVSDFYTVRQSDAHSWVEVYFPKYGWVTFDPTPAAGLSHYDNDWLAMARHYSDAMEMFWLEHVIGFSSNEQAAIVFRAQHLISEYQNESSAWWESWKARLGNIIKSLRGDGDAGSLPWSQKGHALLLHTLVIGLFFLGLTIVSFVWWQQRARSWRRRFKEDTIGSAIAFYQEMLEIVSRTGYERVPHQTPQEFAQMVSLPQVTEITQLYQRVRFGGAQLSEAEIIQIEASLRELQALGKTKNQRTALTLR